MTHEFAYWKVRGPWEFCNTGFTSKCYEWKVIDQSKAERALLKKLKKGRRLMMISKYIEMLKESDNWKTTIGVELPRIRTKVDEMLNAEIQACLHRMQMFYRTLTYPYFWQWKTRIGELPAMIEKRQQLFEDYQLLVDMSDIEFEIFAATYAFHTGIVIPYAEKIAAEIQTSHQLEIGRLAEVEKSQDSWEFILNYALKKLEGDFGSLYLEYSLETAVVVSGHHERYVEEFKKVC